MRKVVLALALAIAITAVLASALARPRAATAANRVYPAQAGVLRKIEAYRRLTWHWQRVMGVPATPAGTAVRRDPSLAYRLWVLRLWKHRAAQVRRVALNPPHKSEWLCIHRYEGSWSDQGTPYYGGLQMDISFQRHYGRYLLSRKGTANHWSPLEQMWVAERAFRSGRGFYPWPNTARYCGLI